MQINCKFDVADLGNQLKLVASRYPKTVRELCEDIGVSHAAWYGWQTEKEPITLDMIDRIEEVTGESLLPHDVALAFRVLRGSGLAARTLKTRTE